MSNRRRLYWRICYASVMLLSLLTFTPLVTPPGMYRPMLFGIPYTLWTGILITVGMVLLTAAATQVYPPEDAKGGREIL